jgi:single-strand DNA-binding protein
MSGLNKVLLIGRLGKDPETTYMPNGKAVTKISVATSESWKDKLTGVRNEVTEWHNVVFFDRLAEIVGEYCRKGSLIYVEGKNKTRSWEDSQTGAKRYVTEVIGSEVQFLDSKPALDKTQHNEGIASAKAEIQKPTPLDDFEDEVPFS